MKQLWDRWGPLTGVLSVACSFAGVMVALDQPQDKDSDAKIVAYFADHSHRVRGVVGFFVFLAGLVLLVAFLGTLRERLVEAERGTGRWSALVFGAGVASVPLWGVSMLLATAASFAANETSSFRLDPNTFRLFAATQRRGRALRPARPVTERKEQAMRNARIAVSRRRGRPSQVVAT